MSSANWVYKVEKVSSRFARWGRKAAKWLLLLQSE